jgi:hypothetical protein
MNNSTAFVQHKKLTLKSDGTHIPVNATGSVFICKEANSPFEMQFDEQGWFPWDQGLSFNIGPDRQFTRLNFRSTNPDEDTLIDFYVGNAAIADSRLNIVRDPVHYQFLCFMVCKTVIKRWNDDGIDAHNQGTFRGIGGSGPTQAGAAYAYRKSILVTNLDAASNIEIFAINGTSRVGTVFPKTAWQLETSDDLIIANETGSRIDCRITELFYPA